MAEGAVLKHEIRSTKSETNRKPKIQITEKIGRQVLSIPVSCFRIDLGNVEFDVVDRQIPISIAGIQQTAPIGVDSAGVAFAFHLALAVDAARRVPWA